MIKTYVPRKKYEVRAVEWQPGMEFPADGGFHPEIITKQGKSHLVETCHETGYGHCPLKPGYFIVKDLYGYEAYTSEGFHKEFVEAPVIHENNKTVV